MSGHRRVRFALACVLWAVMTAARAGFVDGGSASSWASSSHDAAALVDWVLSTDDHGRFPFAVVDKKAARLSVFDGAGRFVGSTPVLLGSALGDSAVPGIGALPVARIPAAARTTPAGRFPTEPGRNLSGEDIVWFDYAAGLAIHRLRPGRSQPARIRALADDPSPDRRASAGCVVVPVVFYDKVVRPLLGAGRGLVYVLPEQLALVAVFPDITKSQPLD